MPEQSHFRDFFVGAELLPELVRPRDDSASTRCNLRKAFQDAVVPYCYSVSGLSVSSEVDLPGLVASPVKGRPPDVTIRRQRVPQTLESAVTSRSPTWEIAGDRFLMRIAGVARFLLTGGHGIAFELEDAAAEADVAIFLTGTVFGVLLHQRQQVVLHASAVRVGGKAVIFCGPSGAGKSTIAAALGERGYPLLNDDVCAIATASDGAPMVHSDGRKLKLWAHSIEKLDLAERRGERVRSRLEKFYVEPEEALSEPLPLGAVYALREARPPYAPGIEAPNVVDAALVLRRSAYRPLLVSRMGQKADYFHAATRIANVAGIFHLTRALDFARMQEVVAWLERHWLELKLTEKAA